MLLLPRLERVRLRLLRLKHGLWGILGRVAWLRERRLRGELLGVLLP